MQLKYISTHKAIKVICNSLCPYKLVSGRTQNKQETMAASKERC